MPYLSSVGWFFARHFDLGITESDVLERMRRGLVQTDSVLSPEEAHWVVRRLAELMEWPDPGS